MNLFQVKLVAKCLTNLLDLVFYFHISSTNFSISMRRSRRRRGGSTRRVSYVQVPRGGFRL